MEYQYQYQPALDQIIVPQYENPLDRENKEVISELYSILYTINSIEKVFIKSLFKTEDDKEMYITRTNELLLQWKSISDSIIHPNANVDKATDNDNIADTDYHDIKQIFNGLIDLDEINNLKFGLRRLKIGINGFEESKRQQQQSTTSTPPAAAAAAAATTIMMEHAESEKVNEPVIQTVSSQQDKKAIAEATSAFITLMDAIKLNYDSKDTLHPLFSDVLTKSSKISTDFDGRNKLVSWLIRVNKLDLSDNLDEGELKEMLWDVDTAYNGFFNQL